MSINSLLRSPGTDMEGGASVAAAAPDTSAPVSGVSDETGSRVDAVTEYPELVEKLRDQYEKLKSKFKPSWATVLKYLTPALPIIIKLQDPVMLKFTENGEVLIAPKSVPLETLRMDFETARRFCVESGCYMITYGALYGNKVLECMQPIRAERDADKFPGTWFQGHRELNYCSSGSFYDEDPKRARTDHGVLPMAVVKIGPGA